MPNPTDPTSLADAARALREAEARTLARVLPHPDVVADDAERTVRVLSEGINPFIGVTYDSPTPEQDRRDAAEATPSGYPGLPTDTTASILQQAQAADEDEPTCVVCDHTLIDGACEPCEEDAPECVHCVETEELEQCDECGDLICPDCHMCTECGMTVHECECCPECGVYECGWCDECGETRCLCGGCGGGDGWDSDESPLLCYSHDVTEHKQAFKNVKGEVNRLYLGVELEVYDSHEDWWSAVPEVDVLDNILGTACCGDSSLDERPYSFEIKVAPATLRYHQELYWPAFKRMNRKSGNRLRAFDVTGYGLHVHVDRVMFTKGAEVKLNTFINHPVNSQFIMDISERYSSSYARLQPVGIDPSCSPQDDDKYIGLNFQHSASIEFRFFKSTTNVSSVMRALEFVDACYRFVEFNATSNTLRYTNFISMVVSERYRRDYPRLVEWLIKKQYVIFDAITKGFKVPNSDVPFVILTVTGEGGRYNHVPGKLDGSYASFMTDEDKLISLGYYFKRTLADLSDDQLPRFVLGDEDDMRDDPNIVELHALVSELLRLEYARSQGDYTYEKELLVAPRELMNTAQYSALATDVGGHACNTATVRFLQDFILNTTRMYSATVAERALKGMYLAMKTVALSDGFFSHITNSHGSWSPDTRIAFTEQVGANKCDTTLARIFYTEVLPCFLPFRSKDSSIMKLIKGDK